MSIPSNCGSHLTMYRVGTSTPALSAGGSQEKLREVVVLMVSVKFCGGPLPENKFAEINSLCLDFEFRLGVGIRLVRGGNVL